MAEHLPEIMRRRFAQPTSLWSNLIPHFLQNTLSEDLLPEEFFSQGAQIYEENNQLHVEVPMPGLNSNDIEVSLNKGILWIKGEAKEEEKNKKRKFYRSSQRNYSFSFMLPTQIDEKAEPQATYEDGILKVTLNKSQSSESKKITVKGSSKNSKKNA